MKIRALDANNDWRYGLGKQDYKTDGNALDQDIITKVRSWKNDCFFDVNAGVDWYNLLGGKNVKDLKSNISSVILSCDGVNSILSFETYLDGKTRQLKMDIIIDTILGKKELNESF
jgi:hypothetical protein